MTYLKQSYLYKTAQDCPIYADVYSAPGGVGRPCIVWIHGGALIFGGRGMLPPAQADMFLSAGYTLVSIDYRLAPETKLDGILEDLRDALVWTRERGPALFGIDPGRLAVVGGSAGGYLALMAGWLVRPRPKALVSFYGYGDITGWYTRPSDHYCKLPAVARAEAYRGVGGKVISASTFTASPDPRWQFYLYCRQQGIWPQEITGRDPAADDRAFDAYCPLRQLTPDYPPTLLLHGDHDTDVPYEQSQLMAAALERHGVPHRLLTMHDLGHAFDLSAAGLQDPRIAAAFDEVLAFLAEYVGG